VLRYVGEKKRDTTKAPLSSGPVRPGLQIIRIDWREDPEPLPNPPPITNFRRYLDQRLGAWAIERESDGPEREGWTCKEYELRPRLAGSAEAMAEALLTSVTQWACELRNAERTWVVLGSCERVEAEKEIRAWRRCAESLEFSEPVQPAEASRWARFYAKNPGFRNAELRVRIRTRLVHGWEAEDTANYLIVYSTKNESLVKHLEKRLEAIRRAYVELFPPAQEITAVSTVRICKDKDEYDHYGGPPGSAGYWNHVTEELVLFDFDNGQAGKEDSRSVLFHEAFHQYIHYAVGELDPHSWFNEGYGDYFSGAEFDVHGDVSRIHVNPWRIRWIQQAIWKKEHPSWSELGWMAKKDYYGPKRPINYAMGWSVIYFLNKAKEVKKRPAWAKILPTYFETLKAAHARARARLEAAGLTEDGEAVGKANAESRDEAASAAFRDVDMREIEEAWREFTLELEAPK